MRSERAAAGAFAVCLLAASGGRSAEPAGEAEQVYRHGFIYTVDAHDSVAEALAVREGRIVYVGGDAAVGPFIGKHTKVVDLAGRMLMPGLVDGHMHPDDGGADLLKCDLNYVRLSVEELQSKVQHCLDETRSREPDGWLDVVHWFREGMMPEGVVTTHAVLDVLKTRRPIVVESSFGHAVLSNSRALEVLKITKLTQAPQGGSIERDEAGDPSGVFDDDAQDLVLQHMPMPTPADDIKGARAALAALAKQGVTSFLNAKTRPAALAAFTAVEREGALTARAHFALLITPREGREPDKAVAAATALARRYDQGAIVARPGITVRNIKLFLDGVIAAPGLTGAMLEPYFVPQSSDHRFAPGKNRGPDVFFPAPVLRALLIDAANAGLEPHLHADGDRAVHEGLDGIKALRQRFPDKDIRAAIAHDEIVDPQDFARFKQLNVVPVLSFQWEKPAPDTIDGARDYLGPARFKYIEPAAYLANAGARIAYGSDWPVDPLDEWFALKVGVTRTNSPAAGAAYVGRLGEDAGLSRAQVLRAITMNSSYELHQDLVTGSLEPGKLADFIVLDRNVLEIPAEEIADVKVLQTVVGGTVVYDANTK